MNNVIDYPDTIEKMCRRSRKGKVYTEEELINAKLDEAPDSLWFDIAKTISRGLYGDKK